MPFCTGVGPCSQLMSKDWRRFYFWSSGPEVDNYGLTELNSVEKS